MSTEAIAHAFGQRLPGVEKWTLVCLARFADEWGYSIFPALDELADKTGFSAATCKRSIQALQDLGRVKRIACSTPVSPAFYQIVGVPEPELPKTAERHCPAALRRAVLYAFALRCEYCGTCGTKEVGPDGKAWLIDRVEPDLRGGTYSPDNVTLSCKTCTSRKKMKPAPPGTRTLTALQTAYVGGGSTCTLPPGIPLIPGRDQPDPRGGSPCTPGGITLIPDLSDLNTDLSSDPESTGAAPRTAAQSATKPASENLAVITKLAHEVLDLYATTPNVTEVDVVDALKWRCAQLDIAYDAAVVGPAIEGAVYQRRRAGKSPVLARSSGDAAYRETEARHAR